MLRFSILLFICFVFAWIGAPASAPRAEPRRLSLVPAAEHEFQESRATDNENHFYLDGTIDAPVQIDCDEMQLFADHIEALQSEGRLIATGNVVYSRAATASPPSGWSSTPGHAPGRSTTPPARPSFATAARPGACSARRSRTSIFWRDGCTSSARRSTSIMHGGFTTCVQPTPRWELHVAERSR